VVSVTNAPRSRRPWRCRSISIGKGGGPPAVNDPEDVARDGRDTGRGMGASSGPVARALQVRAEVAPELHEPFRGRVCGGACPSGGGGAGRRAQHDPPARHAHPASTGRPRPTLYLIFADVGEKLAATYMIHSLLRRNLAGWMGALYGRGAGLPHSLKEHQMPTISRPRRLAVAAGGVGRAMCVSVLPAAATQEAPPSKALRADPMAHAPRQAQAAASAAVGCDEAVLGLRGRGGNTGRGAAVRSLTSAPTTQYSSAAPEASGHSHVHLGGTGQSVQHDLP
jgi:hypothetical protein